MAIGATQTESLDAGHFHSGKAIKYQGQFIPRYTSARILCLDKEPVAFKTKVDLYAALVCELERVGDDIS